MSWLALGLLREYDQYLKLGSFYQEGNANGGSTPHYNKKVKALRKSRKTTANQSRRLNRN